MIPTISTTSRKRSRYHAGRPFKSLSFFGLVLLLSVSQQASRALAESSTSFTSEVGVKSAFGLQKTLSDKVEEGYEWVVEDADEDDEEEGWEYYYEYKKVDADEAREIEEYEYDDEEYDYGYDYDEDYDEEEDEDYEKDEWWTPEQLKEMDALYNRYLQEIATKFGANWEEKFDLIVTEEEIYEKYLEFEEQKKIDAEEQRQLIEATHRALWEHGEALRVEEEYNYNDSLNRTEEQDSIRASIEKSIIADLPTRTHMVVLGTGVGYNKNVNNKNKNQPVTNNVKECPATTTIVTTQRGNTHTVIGSI